MQRSRKSELRVSGRRLTTPACSVARWRATVTGVGRRRAVGRLGAARLVRGRRRPLAHPRQRADRAPDARRRHAGRRDPRAHPGGDAVQRVYSVADAGGLTIIEMTNDSPLPIAVAFSRGDLLSRAAAGRRADRGHRPAAWQRRVPGRPPCHDHRRPGPSPGSRGPAATWPTAEQVVRGWVGDGRARRPGRCCPTRRWSWRSSPPALRPRAGPAPCRRPTIRWRSSWRR